MLTEEVKAFIEILYLIIGYRPLRVMRELPHKRRKMFGLNKLTTKLLKKSGRPGARMEWHIADCA